MNLKGFHINIVWLRVRVHESMLSNPSIDGSILFIEESYKDEVGIFLFRIKDIGLNSQKK